MRRLLVLVAFVGALDARAVTIDWVPIGNPNNSADAPSSNCYAANCGSVPYSYYIAKYEVTNAEYAEFLNAKAASDPSSLYNANMGSDSIAGGITRSGISGSYTYGIKAGFASKPVTYVSFWDALRFSNWLNNGQGNGDTETGSYTITAEGIEGNSVTRNPAAIIVITSENEWYKAAYYEGLSADYFDYPTGTNAITGCVLPGSDTGNSANCSPDSIPTGGPTIVGAYGLSDSPYGTYDQGGNVFEWNEQIVMSTYRGLRGGGWANNSGYLAASGGEFNGGPGREFRNVGFRVATLVLQPGCGDAIVQVPEECDDGNFVTDPCDYGQTSCTVCSSTCQLVAGATSFCGDAVIDAINGETCDDGNGAAADGCSSTCTVETGWTCSGTPSACISSCEDGIDNDGDNQIDYPADPGCGSPNSAIENPQCEDGVENDGDGLKDTLDPGCGGQSWRNSENPACADGIDNDGDTYTDYLAGNPTGDTACRSATDQSEGPDCADGIDNDGDGIVDYPADAGCVDNVEWATENPECSDGQDNDRDGKIDFVPPAGLLQDPQCASAFGAREAAAAGCGLGVELVFPLGALLLARRRGVSARQSSGVARVSAG